MIWEKSIESITSQDIESLVIDRVGETKRLDYKEALPLRSDEAKREFLADVSSFANSGGGIMLFGVKDARDPKGKPTGLPDKVVGLGSAYNASAEELRLQDLIRHCIAPRAVTEIRSIEIRNVGHVCLLRIPASWAAPHMVTINGSQRFYGRNSSGKFRLDVNEIRSAFVQSESLESKLNAFVLSRIAQIEAEETPVKLKGGPRLVLHLLPLQSFLQRTTLNLKSLHLNDQWLRLAPGTSAFHLNYSLNFDGFVVTAMNSSGTTNFAYTQLFRTGAIEFVYAFDPNRADRKEDDRSVDFGSLERQIVARLQSYFDFYRLHDVVPPIEVRISYLNVLGYSHYPHIPDFDTSVGRPIDRNQILVPGTLLEDYSAGFESNLRSALDSVWNAFGTIGSPNFGSDGSWNSRR